jgi:hypothetical protein
MRVSARLNCDEGGTCLRYVKLHESYSRNMSIRHLQAGLQTRSRFYCMFLEYYSHGIADGIVNLFPTSAFASPYLPQPLTCGVTSTGLDLQAFI